MESLSKEDKNDLAGKGLKDNLTATGNTPSEHPSPSATARASESSTSASSSEVIDYDNLNTQVKFARLYAIQLDVKCKSDSPLVYFDDTDNHLSDNIITVAKNLEALSEAHPNDEKLKELTQSAQVSKFKAIECFLSMAKKGRILK